MGFENVHTTYRCGNCGRMMDRLPWEPKRCRYCGSTNLKLQARFT